ncbi:MAG: hypothetical protein K0Q59_3402 [Paenibacillus sp.]|nr:hypothetical protein [Paenibacillus sp.]
MIEPAGQIAEKLHNYLNAQTEQGRFSGSVLVARQGDIILKQGYGWANVELGVPNTPLTKFRIASIGKPFTAMAVLQLHEQGLLHVQDPLIRYVPEYPNADRITIHQLLTHTSGIPNFSTLPDWEEFKMKRSTPGRMIQRFRSMPLDFAPGQGFKYSNSAYVLLAYLVEQVSQQTFGDFIRQRILAPLQMNDTGEDNPRTIITNRASGYELEQGELVNSQFIDMSIGIGSGGLYSTVEDLYRFDRGLYTEKLVSQSTLELIHTGYVRSAAHNAEYGYGWFIAREDWGGTSRLRIGHSGSIYGFKSQLNRYVEDGLAVIVLSNLASSPKDQIVLDLTRIAYGG